MNGGFKMNNYYYIDIKKEIKDALDNGKPVVALESTIISHGMPYPQNVETARNVEKIIRDNGAVPATIAIINGIIKIGLSDDELEFFGSEKNILKASRRDLPYVVSSKKHAATTVATTMICSAMAGIKIFATGGIGGVHRGAEKTFDISADLQELAKTNVAVISAGAKAILDLRLTMEYLETMGVPVVGYQTEYLPAFYSRKSDIKLNLSLDTPYDIANMLSTKWSLGLNGGVLVANPIPEEYSMDSSEINTAIDKAIKEADEKGIKGKDITPFLLAKIKDITSGKSLDSNIQLVYNNAELAAKIAVEMSKIGEIEE